MVKVIRVLLVIYALSAIAFFSLGIWWGGVGAVFGLVIFAYAHQRHTRPSVQPPEGVVAVMASGERIPVECLYLGRKRGTHYWQAVFPLPEVPVGMSAQMIPVNTMVLAVARNSFYTRSAS